VIRRSALVGPTSRAVFGIAWEEHHATGCSTSSLPRGIADVVGIDDRRYSIDEIYYRSAPTPVTKYRHTLRWRNETKPQRCGDSAKPRDHGGALRWCFPSVTGGRQVQPMSTAPFNRPSLQRQRALSSPQCCRGPDDDPRVMAEARLAAHRMSCAQPRTESRVAWVDGQRTGTKPPGALYRYRVTLGRRAISD